MDNYSHTAGPDKNSAKRIISNKLKKNKLDWKYVTEDDIENTVNNMIDNMSWKSFTAVRRHCTDWYEI